MRHAEYVTDGTTEKDRIGGLEVTREILTDGTRVLLWWQLHGNGKVVTSENERNVTLTLGRSKERALGRWEVYFKPLKNYGKCGKTHAWWSRGMASRLQFGSARETASTIWDVSRAITAYLFMNVTTQVRYSQCHSHYTSGSYSYYGIQVRQHTSDHKWSSGSAHLNTEGFSHKPDVRVKVRSIFRRFDVRTTHNLGLECSTLDLPADSWLRWKTRPWSLGLWWCTARSSSFIERLTVVSHHNIGMRTWVEMLAGAIKSS